MSWLDELKEGDKAYINYSDSYRLATVTRITKTLIFVAPATGGAEQAFSKQSGFLRKEKPAKWAARTTLRPYSGERESKLLRQRVYDTIMSAARKNEMESLPLSALQQIESILVEHGVIKEA